jgi:hypothetical protein
VTKLVLLFLLLPGNAPEAQFLDGLARRAYAEGRFSEALSLFGEVAEAAPTPQVFYNMAVAAELSGDPAFAYSLYNRYLKVATDEDPEFQRRFAQEKLTTLAKRLALVRVESTPPRATISIDGQARETFERTPATLALTPGRHRVRVSLEAHESASTETVAERGRVSRVSFTLQRKQGTLQVSLPPGVDGDVRLLTDAGDERRIEPNRSQTVDAGSYELRVDSAKYKTYISPIVVPPDEKVIRSVTLLPLPPEQVKILIRCKQGTREVWIDGTRRAVTPIAMLLSVGEYEVEVRGNGQEEQTWTDTIEVRAGPNMLLDVDLRRDAAPRQ